MRTISREALFEDVWNRPLSTIAPEFGISDVGLRKICDRHDIPTPGRGYWAQVAAGKTFPRPRLRPPKTSALEIITIAGSPHPAPHVQAAVERVRAVRAPSLPTTKPEVAEAPPKPAEAAQAEPGNEAHRHAQRTQAKLAAGKEGCLVHVHGKGLFPVTATPAQAERVGQVLTELIAAVEAMGWAVENDDKGYRLVPDGEPISVELTEQTDRIKHQLTEAEQAALRKHEEVRQRAARRGEWFSDWDRPRIPEWDYVPNGRLQLTLVMALYRSDRIRRNFSDGKTQRIERMIDRVIESLAAYAASEKATRERRERERLEAIEAQKRRETAERRQELENKRVEFLQAQMKRLARVREIESFVREVEAEGPAEGAVASFLGWASDWAADLRAELSQATLREKLERFDLMNDQARIYSWVKVD